jgi:hypothetical protein
MLKDIVVIDDALADPYYWVNLAKTIPFHSNETTDIDFAPTVGLKSEKPGGSWPGYRSDPLNIIAADQNRLVLQELIEKVFLHCDVDARVKTYLNFSPKYVKQRVTSHIDPDACYAGVVYLSPNAPLNSGTIVDGKLVENKFNRLVLYRANIIHSPSSHPFGMTVDDSRLTLNLFITELAITFSTRLPPGKRGETIKITHDSVAELEQIKQALATENDRTDVLSKLDSIFNKSR